MTAREKLLGEIKDTQTAIVCWQWCLKTKPEERAAEKLGNLEKKLSELLHQWQAIAAAAVILLMAGCASLTPQRHMAEGGGFGGGSGGCLITGITYTPATNVETFEVWGDDGFYEVPLATNNARVNIEFEARAGFFYQVEFSEWPHTNWAADGYIFADVDGPLRWQQSTDSPRRFYRLVEFPNEQN